MDFLHFLDRSVSPFHAAQEVILKLKEKGFIALDETKKWNLQKGQGYFVCRANRLVAAFKTPTEEIQKSLFLCSHLDSPSLKVKPTALTDDARVCVEVYGAPILHSWLDRDLALAGQIYFLNQENKLEKRIVFFPDEPLIIPQLAIHLDRSPPEKGFLVNKEEHLKAFFSLNPEENLFEKRIQEKVPLKKLLSFDLFLTSLEKASFIGSKKELIASARLDNLASVFATLSALLETPFQKNRIDLALFWDHEEIGSVSQTGADSSFASELLERIALSFDLSRQDYLCMKASSFALSCDLTHAFHPAFKEKYDPKNAPLLGKGPVIKFNANQKYATDGEQAAKLFSIANQAQIPLQQFASRSDIPSGSTVGSMVAANLGIPTVDLGIASLAMHSIRETIATNDLLQLILFLKEILLRD